MFEKSSSIIRDGSKLDYDYVPKVLVNREEQMRTLETLFTPLAREGRSCTAFLIGSVGTGKTVTAKRFCADMREHCNNNGVPLDVVIVNCRNRNSDTGVMLQIIRHFDKGFPDRGFSPDEMSRILRNHLSSNPRGLVVVLDEVDLLLKKGSTDLIYQLTRFSEGNENMGKVSLIMISQYSLDGLLDQASLSTFCKANKVRFDRYTENELYDIIQARADEAIIPGRISEDAIGMIAKISSDYGDARMAIELLDKSATIAEEDTQGIIDPEHVRAAKAMIYSCVSESKLVALDTNHKLALLAVARAMKTNMQIPISAAEKTYAIVCEEYEVAARKHTAFWGYIQYMERQGLLRTEVSNGSNGRTTLISIPDIPAKVLADKMAEILDSGGHDEVRFLRTRSGDLHPLQRLASLRRAFRPLRGEEGQEGDQETDLRPPRRRYRGSGLRREGQHDGAEDSLRGVRGGERHERACHRHRRGHRRLPPPECRHRPQILRFQRYRIPSPLVLRTGGDDGRDSARMPRELPLHLLRRLQAQAHERRGEEDRSEIPRYRTQPGRHVPVYNDELRQR